jgi:uncharacterized Ntn-hydrolase superfamily protein
MIPKKIACFVEGQTEQIFVERLFISYLNLKSIDVEQRPHPSKDLKKIYQLVDRTYNKSKEVTQEIVNNLDYEFLYLHLVKSVKQLKKFIDEIDSFLVE